MSTLRCCARCESIGRAPEDPKSFRVGDVVRVLAPHDMDSRSGFGRDAWTDSTMRIVELPTRAYAGSAFKEAGLVTLSDSTHEASVYINVSRLSRVLS